MKKAKYDGVKYRSELSPGGFNFAFFKPSKFVVRFYDSYEVTQVRIAYKKNRLPDEFKAAMDRAAKDIEAQRKSKR